MKKFKVMAGVVVLSMSAMLVGCSNQSDSTLRNTKQAPVKEEAQSNTIEEMAVDFETVEYSTDEFTVQVPMTWTLDDTSNPMAIFSLYNEEHITDELTSIITVTKMPENTPQDMNKLMEEAKKELAGQENMGILVNKIELIDMSFGQVIYIDATFKITDEMIDYMIAGGDGTEDLINQMGGREALINESARKQFQIYVAKESKVLAITGSYDDASYDEMKEVALYMAQTLTMK